MNLKFKLILLIVFYFGALGLFTINNYFSHGDPWDNVRKSAILVEDSNAAEGSVDTEYSGYCTYIQNKKQFDMQDFFLAQWKNLPVVVVPSNKIDHITIDELYDRYNSLAIKKCK